MREIKFRIYFEDEEPFISEPITLEDLLHGEDIEFRNEDDTLSLPLNDFRFYYKRNQNYKIMQFTGLKDKNGKEIYEGDIVKINAHSYDFGFEKDRIGEIRFIEGCFGFYKQLSEKEYLFNELSTEFGYGELEYYEVIGNIYENPELLERSSNGD